MCNRFPRLATGLLAFAVVALLSGKAWAVYYPLGPSNDDWGLKYSVAVEDAESGMVTVTFTLESDGRLKPVHSISMQVRDKQNSSSATVKGRLELKPTADGKRVGRMKIRKDEADRAVLQVLTQTFDGRFQAAPARYYDIPLAKHLEKSASPGVASSQSSPTAKGKK